MAADNSNKELAFALGATALSALLTAQSFRYVAASSAFPRFLSLLMLAFSLVMLGRALRAAKNSQSAKVRALPDMTKLKTPLAVFGGTVAYALAMRYVGYFVGTTVFFLCAMTLLGRNRLRTALIASAVFMSVMYALFIWFLGMRLPEGLLV